MREVCVVKTSSILKKLSSVGVMTALLGLSPNFVHAQDETLEEAEWNFALPTGAGVRISEPEEESRGGLRLLPNANGQSFAMGLSGKVVHAFMDGEDATRSELVLMAAVELGPLAAELNLSVEDLLSRAMDDNFEKNGDTYTNGVTTVRATDLVQKAVATLTVAKLTSRDGNDENVVTISLFMGRDNASYLGSFTTEWVPSISVLEHRSLAQQDLIGVRAEVMQNTVVEVVNFGYDFFGYQEDAPGEQFEGIDPDNKDNIAVNVRHKIDDMLGDGNNVELYFSYVHMNGKTQFTRATAGDQPGENDTFAAGAKANINQITVSLEGYALNADNGDDENGFKAEASYDAGRWIPYVSVEGLDKEGDLDMIYSAGVAWKILSNLTGTVQVSHVDPEGGDSDTVVYIGATLTGKTPMASVADLRSE